MATPIYNSKRKQHYALELETVTNKANALYDKLLKLADTNASFEEIMKVRSERNNLLIKIETLQSRINNIGKDTGIEEVQIPKFN